ncbi:beta strand repeat-containing protein [Kineosporia babensis]|uniref:Big-1 domain-containing protein n=1 Tax=Kineosporia babensis TaxID=499548 RepID=A0A9X1SWX8_9ACTN|nr:hypothetical protein [Kineosporia babensis]MCD5309868.1 hypothetical protein [Kineosporia babensis]
MNLNSKKARIPIAALGVTALCSAGFSVLASPAFAAGTEIGLNSGATSIGVGNFGSASAAAANAAYAMKIQETSLTNMVLAVDSAPTGGHVSYQKAASNAAASTGFTQVGAAVNVSEVQTLTRSATPTTGAYTVSVDGVSTASITTYTDTALAAALNAVVGDGNDVTVALSGQVYTITYGGSLSGTNVGPITQVANTLKDAGSVDVTLTSATSTPGSSTPGAAAASLATVAQTDNLYVTGDVPGTYKLRLFQDINANSVYDSADERTSAVVTLNVFDTGGTGTTTSTSDDVDPVIAATSPASAGDAIPAEITYNKTLSMSDARGGVATGLAGRLKDLTWLDVAQTGTTGIAAASGVHPDYSTTTNKMTYAVGTPTGAGSVTVKGDLAATAPASSAAYPASTAKTVTVTASTVAALALAAPAVDGKVKVTGSAVAVKAGTNTVEYTVTAKDGPTPAALPVAGAKVTFTLGGTDANVAKLTADGTAGAATTTSKAYTATTDSKGVATLKVTSSDPSAGSYTVAASSNSVNATQLTTTYAAAAATTIDTTSTSAELTPTVGTTTVVLKGEIKDQFGGAFVPGSSDSTQVTVQVPDGTQAGFAPLSSTGTFSYTYTAPTTPAPAVGDTTTFDFVYGTIPDASSAGGTIRWASAAAVSKITLTAPAAGAKSVGLLGNAAPVPAQANTGTPPFGNTTGAVTGTVYDAANAVLAYKAVTLKGDEGVWFSKTATPGVGSDKLVKTLDVVSDASGVISGAYVYFSKSGDLKVSATSGSTTQDTTVTVNPPAAAAGWEVSVNDVSGAPGSTLIVTGKVMDIFGNPVPSAVVNLTGDPATVGALGAAQVTTNSAGVFSTTFVTGTNSSGDVKLTAEINNNPATLTPNATLVAAGFTAPASKDTADSTISIAAKKLTISSTANVTAGGSGGTAKLSGTFLPNSSVDVYAKESGEKSYGLAETVETDAEGEWGMAIKVDKSTRFLVRSNGMSSPSTLTEVWSKVSLSAKALGKGRVQLSANGDPNVKAPLNFYRDVAGSKDPLVKKVTSSSTGVAKVTVKVAKGTRSFYVTYKAPGTTMGKSKVVKLKVK